MHAFADIANGNRWPLWWHGYATAIPSSCWFGCASVFECAT